jgi:glutamate-1-semialdehyde aminotransferase
MEIMIHSKVLSWITSRIYIAPSAYESWFITDALSYEDLDFTIRQLIKYLKPFDTEKLPVKAGSFFTD